MAKTEFDLGVIGGGAAGLTVASGAAQLGSKVILLERESRLGGDCLHYGCVPSKTLIKTASVYHQIKNTHAYGLPRLELPPVNFRAVRERIVSVVSRIQEHDSEERFCGLGAKVHFGPASFVDEHKVEVDGRLFSADKWLIATGSSPAAPPIPGLAETGYLTNREIFYLDHLPESLTVLGGGPIACEMAQAFARLGSKVTLIQRSKQLLSKEDLDMAELVRAALEADGVRVYTGTKTLQVWPSHGHKSVAFRDSAGKKTVLRGDEILIALGRRPNLDRLSPEAAGVNFGPKGITVDQRLRTSRKNIFAAGDITGSYQFTHAAGYEGGVVLANAVFRLPRKADYTWMPWCTYTEPELASLGLNEKAARAARVEYDLWMEDFAANDRAQAEGWPEGRIKLLLDKKENVLGVQIAGLHAGELIAEWVAALNGKVKLSTLAGAVHPYPTLAEINKRVAGDVMAPKLFSDTVRKGLKFFFHTKGRACALDD